MGSENISVVFTPIIGEMAHGTLVYTNSSGEQFYAGATRSSWATPTTAANALQAEVSQIGGIGSDPLGTLIAFSGVVTPDLNASGPTKNWFNSTNASATLLSGSDLSSQWGVISNTMGEINNLNLQYAPITQNSNSSWCTAALNAGVSYSDLSAAQTSTQASCTERVIT